MSCFELFFPFSGLKQNTSKCEVARVGNLKGVSVAVYGMKCIDLSKTIVKSLGIHFSYDINIQNIQNYLNTPLRNKQVLRLWRMRSLSLDGKTTVFKTFTISKIIHFAMKAHIP